MNGMTKNRFCEECQYSCFKENFSEKSVATICDNTSHMHFSSGEIILKQGSYISQIAFIKEGIVKVVLEESNNRNTIVDIVEGNNFVAIPVLGNSQQYPFTITALNDCDVCAIRVQSILDVLKNDYRATMFFLQWMAEDYLNIYKKISTISTRNSHGKLASALLYLTNSSFKSNALNSLSRKELAELASVSIESANKILMQLKHDGIIDITQNKITLVRRDLIEKLSTVG